MPQKAIIIGASSGMGLELAKILSAEGYELGITARRKELLEELKNSLPGKVIVQQMDVAETQAARAQLQRLITELGGVDLVIISSAVGFTNHELSWEKEQQTIAANVNGFVAMAQVAMEHFLEKKHGHLVGISSIAALMGNRSAPSYNASKAFVSNFLAGLHQKMVHEKLPIVILDVKPGFVDTRMAKAYFLFWVASPAKAAQQIYQAIKKKKRHLYVTKRWRLIAWIMKALPRWVWERV